MLWNPYQLCGIPWLGTLQGGFFYPPHLVYLFLPTPWALALCTSLHLALAAGARDDPPVPVEQRHHSIVGQLEPRQDRPDALALELDGEHGLHPVAAPYGHRDQEKVPARRRILEEIRDQRPLRAGHRPDQAGQ